jgi:dsRNA-specific ribonuclease
VFRSNLVNNRVLSDICTDHLEISDLIQTAPSAALTSRGRQTINAGAVESLIAAIYLDQVPTREIVWPYAFV